MLICREIILAMTYDSLETYFQRHQFTYSSLSSVHNLGMYCENIARHAGFSRLNLVEYKYYLKIIRKYDNILLRTIGASSFLCPVVSFHIYLIMTKWPSCIIMLCIASLCMAMLVVLLVWVVMDVCLTRFSLILARYKCSLYLRMF